MESRLSEMISEDLGTGSCEEIVFVGCFACRFAVACLLGSSELCFVDGDLRFSVPEEVRLLATLGGRRSQIEVAPYAEPPCQVVAEARPRCFHRHLQAAPAAELS